MTSLLQSNFYKFDDVGKKVATPLAKSLGPACHSLIVSLSRGEKLFERGKRVRIYFESLLKNVLYSIKYFSGNSEFKIKMKKL